jgi:two-component system, NarL family, sensor histidine kinase UhpB
MAMPAAARAHLEPRSLDLKRSLMLRVSGVALCCFLVAAALAVYGTYRDIRQANEAAADVVARHLEMQLWRIEASIDVPARFPDWDAVIDRIQGAGQCIHFADANGSVRRSGCVGTERHAAALPPGLSSLGTWLLGTRADSSRPVANRGRAYGTLVVTTDTAVVLAAVWKDVSRLLGLTALLVGAICLLQYVAVGRALRPTRDILVGLDRLARDDLTCRLPSFRLIELQRISEVFNALAAALDRTRHERTQLATRLVDGQEQERRRLARELHDELAQTLSAIGAGAASIKATAEAECPALVEEADRLVHTTMATMRSLRRTLETLRPPEIDDFGLAASLAALARDQERRTGGKLQIRLDADDGLRSLPPTAAAHVYRIVQEGLTNIAKHAHASQARVALEIHPGASGQARPHARWLALTIEDDGCGGAGHGTAADGHGPGSGSCNGSGNRLGLIGMRERAMALGGQLDVIREDGGFKLQAVIPLAGAETVP